jgi:hypothetical protein
MENQDETKEPISGESEPLGKNLDLGRRICARYGGSPGVIPMGFAPGLARRASQFADRFPLLQTLQRRWNMDGFSFPVPANPLWLHAPAAGKVARHATSSAVVVSRSSSSSAGAPAGVPKVDPSPSNAVAPQASGPLPPNAVFKANSPVDEMPPPGPGVQSAQVTPSVQDATATVSLARKPAGTSDSTSLTTHRPAAAALPGSAAPSGSTQSDVVASAISLSPVVDSPAIKTVYAEAPTPATAPVAGMIHRSGDNVTSDSRLANAPPQGTPIPSAVESASSKAVHIDAPIPSAKTIEPAGSISRAPNDAALPSTSASHGHHQSGMLTAGVSSAPSAGMIHRSSDNVVPDTPLANAPSQGTPILPAVGSAPQTNVRAGATTQAAGAAGPVRPAEPSRVGEGSTSRPISASRGTGHPEIARRELSTAGTAHGSGGSLSPAHIQRKTGGKSGNEPNVARLAPANSKLAPQTADAGEKIGKAPEAPSRNLPASSQMGPPIFLRQAKSTLSRAGGQNPVSPVVKNADSSPLTVPAKASDSFAAPQTLSREKSEPHVKEIAAANPLPAIPVHVSRSKAATEVARAAAQASHEVQSTKDSRHLASRTAGDSSTDAGTLPSVRSTPAESSPRGNAVLARGSDQAHSVVVAETPVVDPVGGSASPTSGGPTFVQRKAAALPASPSQSYDAASLGKNTVDRVDSQTGRGPILSSSPETVPSLAPNAAAVLKSGGSAVSSVSGASGPGSLPQHPIPSIAHAKPATSIHESGTTPVVHSRPASSTPPAVQPVLRKSRDIQPRSDAAFDPARMLQEVAPQTGETARIKTGESTPGATIEAVAPDPSPVVLQESAIDHAPVSLTPASGTAGLPPNQLHGQPISSGDAIPVLRRAASSSPNTTASPAFALSPSRVLPAKPEVTHRVWRQTDVASGQPRIQNGAMPSPPNVMQRSAASPTSGPGAQAAPAPPGLPDSGNRMSQVLPAGDMAQLANRVYELLVRRLAGEKLQRGL